MVKTTIAISNSIWIRAKVQAARQQQNLQDFSASAIEFYTNHLEEQYRAQIIAEFKGKKSA